MVMDILSLSLASSRLSDNSDVRSSGDRFGSLSAASLRLTESPIYDAGEQAAVWARLCNSPPARFILTCTNILNQLDSGTFAATDLLTLRHVFDIECIRLQGSNKARQNGMRLREALLEPQVILTATSSLSKRLIKHHSPDTPRTREWQLRALISAFALLSYHNTTHISDTELNRIQRDLGQMSQDAQWQQRLSNDSLSHGACLYLVRLAADYSKAFRSDQPLWVTTIARVLNFAVAAGVAYQCDGRRAVDELDNAFRTLRQNRQEKYKALGYLCELTRTIRIIRYWALALKIEDRVKAKYLDDLAKELAKRSIAETLKILDNDPNLENQPPQNFFQSWGDNLNATLSRPSNLGAPSYMYGLLDNAAQLGQLFPIHSLNIDFTKRLLALIMKSSAVDQFQLKSMEIMLAFPPTRDGEFKKLQKKIGNEVVLQWIPNQKQANITVLVNQLITIRESLDSHDVAIGNFWLSVSKLLPIQQTPELPIIDSFTPSPAQRLPLEPKYLEFDTESSPQTRLAEIGSDCSSSPLSQSPFRQSKLNPYEVRWSSVSSESKSSSISRPSFTTTAVYSYAKEMANFVPFNITTMQPATPRQYPLSRRMGRQRNYFASGISSRCNHVFFLEQALAEVFEIPLNPRTPTPKEPVLRLKSSNKDLYRSASVGDSLFAIIAGSSCSLYAISNSKEVCNPIRLAGWDPECVALGTFASSPAVAIGWRSGMAGTDRTRGKLTVHLIPQQHVKANLQELISISLREADYPKCISLTQFRDFTTIICTTQRLNIVSAWRLSLQPPHYAILCSTARSFTAEAGVEGVTSAQIFKSPAGNPYILCTTSHSSERRKEDHDGEFPFLAPAITPFPKFDSPFFHPITQFIHKPALQAAAIPPLGSMVALLDRSGQIWLLRLEPNGQGGLRSADKPEKVSVKLASGLVGRGASLRFSPDATRLVGADHKGDVVVMAFERVEIPGGAMAEAEGTGVVELPAFKEISELDGTGIGFDSMSGYIR